MSPVRHCSSPSPLLILFLSSRGQTVRTQLPDPDPGPPQLTQFCVVSQKVTSSGSCLLIGHLVSCGLVVGGGVQLVTSALRGLPGRQSVWRLQRCVTRPPAAAGGEVGPEGWREEAVDDWVAAGVQVPKHKEGVVDVLRCDLQHAGLKPVPDPQQVVWSPAHDKGQHDDHCHLQSLHPSLWDDVSAAATQVRLSC